MQIAITILHKLNLVLQIQVSPAETLLSRCENTHHQRGPIVRRRDHAQSSASQRLHGSLGCSAAYRRLLQRSVHLQRPPSPHISSGQCALPGSSGSRDQPQTHLVGLLTKQHTFLCILTLSLLSPPSVLCILKHPFPPNLFCGVLLLRKWIFILVIFLQ